MSVRIGILGAGGIARRHLEALAAIESAEAAAVFDIDPARAAAAAQSHGATATESVDECIAAADAVLILTPPASHRELALAAVRAGKHVLCEKPLAAELADAREMVRAAREAGVLLMTAFNMRFRRGFVKLSETVRSGTLGEPISFWCQRLGIGVGAGPNWRTDPQQLCGMSIESLSHDIDLIRWVLGDVADVRASVFNSRADLPGFDDNASVLCTMAGGASAMIHASWSSQVGTNARGVVGTEGTAVVSGRGLWQLAEFRWKTAEMPHERVELIDDELDGASYLAEDRHFIECVENGTEPEVTGADGLAALEVSHAILASHRTGTTVRLAAEA